MITRPRILLRKGQERRVLGGHPWVFSNEIEKQEGPEPGPGDLVEVRRVDGALLGVGLYHPSSLIAVRLFASAPEASSLGEVDAAYFRARLAAAQKRRMRALGPAATSDGASYRLCHAEADGLPGVVVDRFGDVLVLQVACLGVEMRREALLDALEDLCAPRAIVHRGESVWRQQEGLDDQSAVLRGNLPEGGLVDIQEHGLFYAVDPLKGQKTGWFLDQRDHRLAIRPYAARARCLDLCTYQGGFALNALAAGASSVLAMDISEGDLARTRTNAERNGLAGDLITLRADVMDLVASDLPTAPGQEAAPYDLIVLDPPSFTRSRKSVAAARRAYRKLNAAALGWLAPGGVLATASCSHHVYEETFLQILDQAAQDARRPLRILYRGFQPPDHPVLMAMPETRYLKFFMVQV